jgi:hypothetical protein
MSAQDRAFASAQEMYDRELPEGWDDEEEPEKAVFSDADIAPFIKAFSESEGLSLEWLEDRGIDGNIVGMCGEMLRDFAKVDVLKIYMPAGVEFEFLTVMKEFALQAFNKASND